MVPTRWSAKAARRPLVNFNMPLTLPQMVSKFRLLVLRQTPVIVFSAERTGTVGMLRSLEASCVLCMGSHYLAPANRGTPRMSRMARWASRCIIEQGRPASFITLVRDPIDMMLSAFARSHAALFQRENSNAHDLMRQLFCRDWIETGRYRQPLEWLGTELAPALGINPYEHDFDPKLGAVEINQGPFRLLILRTDLDDQTKAARINAFLKTRNFVMLSKDTVYGENARSDAARPGSTAHHGAMYDLLHSSPLIPPKTLNEIVTSRYVRHFFDDASINAMRQRMAPARHQAPPDAPAQH